MVNYFKTATFLVLIFALGACARFETPLGANKAASSQSLGAAQDTNAIAPSTEFADNGILSFLPNEVLTKLSLREKNEAASAQFFALQYGRVGATREWTADSATRGEISVGPYIKVNKLDCREFSHIVIVGDDRYTKSGTSCREQDGQWTVVS